jgi:hypothetical protein
MIQGKIIVILPEGQKMNSTYFIEWMLSPLTEFVIHRAGEHMKGESYCILTMHRFTTLRRFKRV